VYVQDLGFRAWDLGSWRVISFFSCCISIIPFSNARSATHYLSPTHTHTHTHTYTHTHIHTHINRHEYVTMLPPPQAVFKAFTESLITRRRQPATSEQTRVLPIPHPICEVRVHIARAGQGWFHVGCTDPWWAQADAKCKGKDQVQVRDRGLALVWFLQTWCID
jgi:hypothetical protein